MSTVRFGAKCDNCGVVHNNYSVEDIAYCNDCEKDLCDICAEKLGHKTKEDSFGRRRRESIYTDEDIPF